ncbi:TIGR02285 family protein [Pseudomonas defluvii]|jgi:uncharacterized protein (TIGR02285 family)|uniref:TIGR02285 family protein n=1 Tax=Pseudomonas defluvii TaxID=1876757 RepID=UPI000811A85B|nr:TIGR02285 family protein [Pseudomonas defluvii]MBP9961209.1 TIGR02285 family protein [Pseudomonas sp.]
MLGAVLGILLGIALPTSASAKETLTWLLRDLPPLTIFEGPQKGQGVVDLLLKELIANMPEYDHSIVRVNRARALQMLQSPTFTCDPTLIWTPERDRYVTYSIPNLGALSNGLVVRKQDASLITPFLKDGKVDLEALLASRLLKLGIVAERSYGPVIDDMLKAAPQETLSRHYGNDAVTNLLQMQHLGRLHLLLGYLPEIRYLSKQQQLNADHLTVYPLKSLPRYQFTHVGCSDTPQGNEAIKHIDQLLQSLRQDLMPTAYARWLDPELRDSYLNDARHFFDQRAADAAAQTP